MAISRTARWFFGTSASAIALVVVTVFVLTRQVTTRQGVNYQVSTHRIPLYVKATEFINRSAQYAQIASEIVSGAPTDEARALAVFAWTCRNIRPIPEGFPVVDDHILNVIIRGYGAADQQADVFATLAWYAGVPAFRQRVPADHQQPGVTLSFARIDGNWRAFDVAHGFIFHSASGGLATLEDLTGRPELLPARSRDILVDGTPYPEIITRALTPAIPHPLPVELQTPLPRLWHEMKTAIGAESEP